MVQRIVAESDVATAVEMVCFDLGGVLVRISQNWQEALDSAGVESPKGRIYTMPLTACEIFDQYQAGALDADAYFAGMAEFFGGISPEDAKKVHNGILIEPYPGTYKLVRDLHKAGYRTGCLSNTNEPHWETMHDGETLPAIASLGVKMASHDVKLQKPDEAIFRAFENASGLTGAQIVYFDDTAVNVDAAKGIGWRAYLIDPKADTTEQMRAALAAEGVEF
jgi:glucose-1-phosphatase